MTENEAINEFFKKGLLTNYHTCKNYKHAITKYFEIIKKDIDIYFPFDLITHDEKGKELKYPKKDFFTPLEEYEKDLTDVYAILEETSMPLLNRKTFFCGVKQFLVCNDKRLKNLDFWTTLKRKTNGAGSISKEFVPNLKDLKKILMNADSKSKAMFLMMCSGGMRIGELLAITKSDINLNSKPVTVEITKTYDPKKEGRISKYTKTRRSRQTYISQEATDALIEYLKHRDEYLLKTIAKSKFEKDENDPRVFPMSDENCRFIWSCLVKKSQIISEEELKDPNTKRDILHPHCLRKTFRSYLGNPDLSNFLMGHASGMDKHYLNKKPEDLAQEYLELEHNVSIFSVAIDEARVTGLEKKLDEKTKEIEKLREAILEKRIGENKGHLEDLIKKILEEKGYPIK